MSTTKRDERQLDDALEQTFPASDPIAPHEATGTEQPHSDPHRQAPDITHDEVEAAAAKTETCSQCGGSGVVAGASGSGEAQCPTCLGLGRLVVVTDGIDAVRPKPEGSAAPEPSR